MAASAAAIPAQRFGDFTSLTGLTRLTSLELTYITSAFTKRGYLRLGDAGGGPSFVRAAYFW